MGYYLGNNCLGYPPKGTQHFPLTISPILQAFYESQLIGRNFWTIKILCDSCMNRNLDVWGRKTVQVANEFISPFTTVSEPSTRMTAWYGCTKHLRSSSCTAEMPTSFLRHNKHNVQSIFWNAFYPTSLQGCLSWTLKSSALSKMKCSEFSHWYQIILCSSMWWVYYSGHTLPGLNPFQTRLFKHSIEPRNASCFSHGKKKTLGVTSHEILIGQKRGFLAVMYISSIKISRILQSTHQTNCWISFCSSKFFT